MLHINLVPASLVAAILSVLCIADSAAAAEVTNSGDPSTTVIADGVQPAPGTAIITWPRPVENSDGSPLTNLAGYVVFYGTGFPIPFSGIFVDANATELVIENLSPGEWYFRIESVDTSGTPSDFSPTVMSTIQ